MKLEELKQAVVAVDPSAVLVAPRVVRRILQAEFRVPYLLVEVPHQQGYFFDRQAVFRHVEQDELGLELDRQLPPVVVLLARPAAEQLQSEGREEMLLKYWRLLFHVHVHLALRDRERAGRLTAELVRERVEQIGRTEFEEVRGVLDEEHLLLPPGDDASVYMEFAALYLELRYFRANLRATYFPALGDLERIDRILAQDVEADALFARTRLAGAPDPVIRTDTSSDETHDYYRRLLRQADEVRQRGDGVRSAILRTRAARVAPADLAEQTRAGALEDLQSLTSDLRAALDFSPEGEASWLRVLPALLDKADQGRWPVEARLLTDLQNLCAEHKRRPFALDLVEWVLSAGKRPIRRPLPGLQRVRITKHLRGAAQRLPLTRISDEDRRQLALLMRTALQASQERLSDRFRPLLHDAFHDVGLTAANPPEQAALDKMIGELLDRITEHDFFTFSDLRDVVSRNQLKLPDVSDPHAFWRGDALLRLDRRLATLLEGVYRPADFYLRWLEKASVLAFGTETGRFLVRNLAIPFGGALLLLKALEVTLGHWFSFTLPTWLCLPLGSLLLAWEHVEKLRVLLHQVGDRTLHGLHLILYEYPLWVWRLPWVGALWRSWPVLLFYWYVLKPLVVVGALWLGFPALRDSSWALAVVFLAANLILNSRFGTAATEALSEGFVLLYGWLRADVLEELVRGILFVFRRVTDTFEHLLYTVDEWLRFRSDENRLMMLLRAGMGVLWFPVGYLTRLYFLTLIEPSINPIKYLFSSLAFKFMLFMPWYFDLTFRFNSQAQWDLVDYGLAPYLGRMPAALLTFLIVVPTLWLLPSAFAFLIWEMLANWRLFRANRAAELRPVIIGGHGETMLRLLKPGLHSGTVPHLYAQLRRAERTAYRTKDWRAARGYTQALQETARSVGQFVEREFLALLLQSKTWPNPPVRVGRLTLSCNRIRVQLTHAEFSQDPAELTFEERSGWLIGSLRSPGWTVRLTPAQRQVLTLALAGLYKAAGVDLIWEQLTAALAPSCAGLDLVDHNLVTWTDQYHLRETAYDLRTKGEHLTPVSLTEEEPKDAPVLVARRTIFARAPVTWEEWVASWREDQQGIVPTKAQGKTLAHLVIEPTGRAGGVNPL